MDDYTITGESLWRNQSYGVENHSFDIKTYLTLNHTTYPTDPDPVTGSCPYEYYTTDYCQLYNFNQNYTVNTLEIKPYSANNDADYSNGVSTLDLVAIEKHLLGDTYFEDISPYDDAPYRYISADADYDNDVDEDDIDMIHDLILVNREDLTRNSWEWVSKDEVENSDERFIEDPYSFVIDYNWPGSEGIIFPELSTNGILGDLDTYFDFRTTKIGDVVGTGGGGSNTWICGTGYYIGNNGVASRSTGIAGEFSKIRKGSIITVGVYIDSYQDLIGLELPVSFSKDDYQFEILQFRNDLKLRWNYSSKYNRLIISDFNKDLSTYKDIKGRILEFQIKAKRDIRNINTSIGWDKDREVELIGMHGDLIDPEVHLEINYVNPTSLYAEVRDEDGINKLWIESPEDQNVNVQYISLEGVIIRSHEYEVKRGDNTISIEPNLIPGIYFIRTFGKDQNYTAKYTNQ